ncbi:hypothetical protein ACSQ67_010139 [Phaseolus vulgaris]
MSNQQQTPVTAYPVDQSNLAAPPPPVGYPTKDNDSAQQTGPVKTTFRGDGFWKGCMNLLFVAVVLDCAVAVPWIVVSDLISLFFMDC